MAKDSPSTGLTVLPGIACLEITRRKGTSASPIPVSWFASKQNTQNSSPKPRALSKYGVAKDLVVDADTVVIATMRGPAMEIMAQVLVTMECWHFGNQKFQIWTMLRWVIWRQRVTIHPQSETCASYTGLWSIKEFRVVAYGERSPVWPACGLWLPVIHI